MWRSLMPAVAGDTTSELVAAARRLAALDPLLPAPAVPAGCGAELAVSGPDGATAALGTCGHWAGEPGSLELTWGAARRFQLTPQIAGPDVAAALDELLARWREHLAALPEAAEEDTAAVLDLAQPGHRRRQGPAAARAGPAAVIAARAAGRRAATGVPVEPGVRIRQAGPADLDAGRPARHGDDPVRRPLRHRDRAAGDAGRAAPRGGRAAGRPGPVGVAGRAGRGSRSACSTRNGRSWRAGSPRWCGRRRWPTWS